MVGCRLPGTAPRSSASWTARPVARFLAEVDALVGTAHHVMLFGVALRFGQSPALRSRPVRKVGFLQSGVG